MTNATSNYDDNTLAEIQSSGDELMTSRNKQHHETQSLHFIHANYLLLLSLILNGVIIEGRKKERGEKLDLGSLTAGYQLQVVQGIPHVFRRSPSPRMTKRGQCQEMKVSRQFGDCVTKVEKKKTPTLTTRLTKEQETLSIMYTLFPNVLFAIL